MYSADNAAHGVTDTANALGILVDDVAWDSYSTTYRPPKRGANKHAHRVRREGGVAIDSVDVSEPFFYETLKTLQPPLLIFSSVIFVT